MQIYALIAQLIPAWLLMLMAALVAFGWLWRRRMKTSYILPRAVKDTGAISWGGVALFYAVSQFGDPPLPAAVAMVRVIWLILLFNEIMQHIYIWRIRSNAKRR